MTIHSDKGLPEVSQTLFIPLLARVRETLRPDALFQDPEAIRVAQELHLQSSRREPDWLSQAGIAIRTEILDATTRAVVNQMRDVRVVNLGAGLCTRYYRLGCPAIEWIEMDMPEVIALRRRLFEETAYHRVLPADVVDHRWMAELSSSQRPHLFIAEGLLMYLRGAQVKSLFLTLCARFPGSLALVEGISSWWVRFSRLHPSVGRTRARFHWGIESGKEVEHWGPGIRLEKEWFYLDRHPERWGCFAWARYVHSLRTSMRIMSVRLGIPDKTAEPDDVAKNNE